MENPLDTLRRYHLTPRKKLGQSFLVDAASIHELVEQAGLKSSDVWVEIGAGVGAMTKIMAPRVRKLIALELDENLAAVLRLELSAFDNLEIIQTDVLQYDFRALSGLYKQKIKVIGNIPYYITSPIIFQIMDNKDVIDKAVLMLQSEVAQRLLAPPGGRDYGIPTVILSMYADVNPRLSLSPGQFFPSPKVSSEVIEICLRPKPRVALLDPEFFVTLVRVAFAQRRKTIYNNLKRLRHQNITEKNLVAALEALGIAPTRRAETLSTEEFGLLANQLLSGTAGN